METSMKIRIRLLLAAFIALPALAMQVPQSQLHQAARNRNQYDRLADFLYDGSNVNQRDRNGNTPLHEAAANGCLDNAELLIEFGADINARNHRDETPLDLALNNGRRNVVELLLEDGAQPTRNQPQPRNNPQHNNNNNNNNQNINPNRNHEGKTRLHLEAATKGRAAQVLQILQREGAQLIHLCDNYGNTALHEACFFGCGQSVRHLLNHGAKAHALNHNGHSPFDKALQNNQHHIIGILDEHILQDYNQPQQPVLQVIQQRPQQRQPQQQQRPQLYQPQQQRPQTAQTPQRGQARCVLDDRLLRLPGLTGGRLNLPIPVYHVESNARMAENQDWCCSFHTLNNAVKLERIICNRQINGLKNACRDIAPKNQLRNGSEADISLEIAEEIGLPHFYNLIFERGSSNLSEDHGRNENQVWGRLRTTFTQSRGPICIHFDCDITSRSARNPRHSEPHSILIAAIKMADGAVAIYILDNVNEDEHTDSQDQIRRHVENIYRRLMG